jgi:hypothetical protein
VAADHGRAEVILRRPVSVSRPLDRLYDDAGDPTKEEADGGASDHRGRAEYQDCEPRGRGVGLEADDQPDDPPITPASNAATNAELAGND